MISKLEAVSSRITSIIIDQEKVVFDIPDAEVIVGKTPVPPEGYEIARVDVVVRLMTG